VNQPRHVRIIDEHPAEPPADFELVCESGDALLVHFSLADNKPRLMLTLDDVDNTPLPTAELTLEEARELAEVLGGWCR